MYKIMICVQSLSGYSGQRQMKTWIELNAGRRQPAGKARRDRDLIQGLAENSGGTAGRLFVQLRLGGPHEGDEKGLLEYRRSMNDQSDAQCEARAGPLSAASWKPLDAQAVLLL